LGAAGRLNLQVNLGSLPLNKNYKRQQCRQRFFPTGAW
jgi:hypothetical protein